MQTLRTITDLLYQRRNWKIQLNFIRSNDLVPTAVSSFSIDMTFPQSFQMQIRRALRKYSLRLEYDQLISNIHTRGCSVNEAPASHRIYCSSHFDGLERTHS